MIAIFLQTLPFFLLIGIGYGAAATRFFSAAATASLTRFVYYFALSAMLFRFSANLSIGAVFDLRFIGVYLWATSFVYLIATAVALWRRLGAAEAAVEAQCAVIGNTGFLGIPMLSLLMGQQAVGFIMMMLAVDLLGFGSLIVMMITGSGGRGLSLRTLRTVARGLFTNPMLVSIFLGFSWSALALPLAAPIDTFLSILAGAATPGALFAIGAALAGKSAERLRVAGWLSFAKLVLHPLAVAVASLLIWPLQPYPAAVMIAATSLPTAGNIFMLAQHYNVAPQRVSATILISTAASVVTVSLVLAWLAQWAGFQ